MKQYFTFLLLGATLLAPIYFFTDPEAKPKPNPCAGITSLAECPEQGCGGDTLLNRQKNISAKPEESDVKIFTFTKFTKLKKLSSWKDNKERSSLKKLGEGTPVSYKGYLIDVKHYTGKKAHEACNCGLIGEENNDFHLVLVPRKDAPEDSSVTAEMSPRSRPASWTYKKLTTLAVKKTFVEVTGWLMFDTKHAGQSSPARITHWEVHPVTKFRVRQGNKWTEWN